jgi:hypothetical protein
MIQRIVEYIPYLIAAVRIVVEYVISVWILRVPVSYPGDPRKKPLTRRGKWRNRSTTIMPGWKFASDKESHEITEKGFPGMKLTGESAGRQIWYRPGAEEGGYEIKDAATAHEFCPSENPNSSDKLLREIMLNKW